MSNLWELSHYRSSIGFIIGNHIREYDITKANISILRDYNALSEEEYQYFLNAPKIEREISIGKLRGSNPKLTEILNEGIINARKAFIEINNISDNEILQINNDSITIIGNNPVNNLDISSRTHFRLDGEYSSYYRLYYLDIYYLYNIISNKESIEIKGIGDEAFSLHKDFMIDLLLEIFYRAQVEGVKQSISLLSDIHKKYIGLAMPIGYYREFNSQSRFKIESRLSEFASYYMDFAVEPQKKILDISYNESIFRLLNQIYASIYLKSN